MKHIITLILLSIFIISCETDDTKSDSRDCQEVEYESLFDLGLGDEVCFPDGNSFIVKAITDEFCCCLCLCFWEGEMRILVETTIQNGEKELLTFGSSTFETENHIFDNFEVSNIEYKYKNEPNSLPLCEGTYDPKEVKLTFEVSAI